MNGPNISVILPVFNSAEYVMKSIDSIVDQTYNNLELIVINDASTDGTSSILSKYDRNFECMNLIENNTNQGITKSLNIGLENATGTYIARQDSDDISFPSRLRRQYEYLEKNPNIELVGTSCIDIDENGEPFGKGRTVVSNSDNIAKMLEFRNCVLHSSIMFRNSGWKYREKFQYAQDYDLYLRMLTENKNISNINSPLIKFRQHSESISGASGHKQSKFGKIAKRFYQERIKTASDSYEQFESNDILDSNQAHSEVSQEYDELMMSLRNDNKDRAQRALGEWKDRTNPSLSLSLLFYILVKFPDIYHTYRNSPTLYKISDHMSDKYKE